MSDQLPSRSPTHPKRMWIFTYRGYDHRYGKLLAEFSKRLAQKTGMQIEQMQLPYILHWSAEKWKETLPEEMLAHPPDIVLAQRVELFPPQKMIPNAFRITSSPLGVELKHQARSPDAFMLTPDAWDFGVKHQWPEYSLEKGNLRLFPLEHCLFDAERYAQACQQAELHKQTHRKTITVLIGDPAPHTSEWLQQIRDLATRQHAKLLISGSTRTTEEDWEEIKRDLAGFDTEFYWSRRQDANTSTNNPYYRFLAAADAIIALDSGSMAAEAAHTGKPVYADEATIRIFSLTPYVHSFKYGVTLEEPPLPKLDIAGGMADAVIAMHTRFRQKQASSVDAGFAERVLHGKGGAVSAWR